MTEGTELLARWLRQRREMGESELVLESLAGLSLTGPTAAPPPPKAAPSPTPPPPPEVLTPIERAAGATAPGATELEIVQIGDLAALREVALGCPRCRLSETRTHVVFGEGSPTADVVVVGEAPGAEEDRTGRPFVGRAGKLLDLMLASVGFPRESVFICNVLKCRPPGNRNPQADEVAACSPYLVRQLELVRPRAIFAVGTFAAQALLGTTVPIGRLRGTVHTYREIPLIPTYHPAALLRNPAWVRPAWEDLQRLRTLVDPS
jgi:uracil-DNA glycosylase